MLSYNNGNVPETAPGIGSTGTARQKSRGRRGVAIAKLQKSDSRTSAAEQCRPVAPEGERPDAVLCAPKRETAAGNGSPLFSARSAFALCGVIFLAHCVISLFFTPDIYRDVAGCYAWYAREFGRGTWHDVPISFLPPLTICLAGPLVFLGVEAYAAVKALSLFFFALTLLPLYRLLELMDEKKAAPWGCLLFIAAPRLLRYSGMALLEPVRDFFLVSAICLLIKGWKKGIDLTDSLLLGASLGLMSLARGEGAVLAFFILCARCYVPKSDRPLRTFARSVLPAVLMMAAVLLPTIAKNYSFTGYPVIDQRMNSILAHCPVVNRWFEAKKFSVEKLVESGWLRIDDAVPQQGSAAEKANRKAGKEENEFSADDAAGRLSPPLERLMLLPQKMVRGGYEFYMCVALLGLLVLIVRRKWRAEHSFLLGFCALTPLAFVFFSVSSRYFIFFIPLLMVFTLNGFAFLWEQAGRYRLRPAAILVLTGLLAAQLFNPWSYMTRHDGGESRRLAEFIKANRKRFNPLNRSKLILHGSSEVTYYCDEARLLEYPQRPDPFETVKGFDLLVLASRKPEAAVCAGRKDLCQVASPDKKFVLFVPNRKRSTL